MDDLLVIGSGSGNGVAVALANGAQHVDDGRAYLERSDKKWDQIVLALPDSLTLVQGASSIRLESYLFTR